MKTSKRFFSLLTSLVLIFVCSATAFAADTTKELATTEDTSLSNEIVPLAEDWVVGLHVGSTSTSEISENFTIVSGAKRASMSVEINVQGPCTLYVFLYDANRNMIGASSLTCTRAGNFTMIPSPSSLSAGNYYYGFYFDRTGVSYQLLIKATF